MSKPPTIHIHLHGCFIVANPQSEISDQLLVNALDLLAQAATASIQPQEEQPPAVVSLSGEDQEDQFDPGLEEWIKTFEESRAEPVSTEPVSTEPVSTEPAPAEPDTQPPSHLKLAKFEPTQPPSISNRCPICGVEIAPTAVGCIKHWRKVKARKQARRVAELAKLYDRAQLDAEDEESDDA